MGEEVVYKVTAFEEVAEEAAEEAAECDIDDPFAMMGGMGEEVVYKVTAFEEKAEAEESKEEEQPLTEAQKGKLKKVMKEGGKRGVEIEGAADMGGLQFFCTSLDEPAGDLVLLKESMKAMNAKSDPTEEERKGGSGHIGKMIFSAGVEELAVVAYVPEEKLGEISSKDWLEAVLSSQGGSVVSGAPGTSTGLVKANADKGIFPLKIREPMILEANNFLRAKGLFPDVDDDSDDEMVFGDDDFPSADVEDAAAEPSAEVEEEEAECDIDDPFAMMGGMGEETVYKVTAFEEKAEAAPAPVPAESTPVTPPKKTKEPPKAAKAPEPKQAQEPKAKAASKKAAPAPAQKETPVKLSEPKAKVRKTEETAAALAPVPEPASAAPKKEPKAKAAAKKADEPKAKAPAAKKAEAK